MKHCQAIRLGGLTGLALMAAAAVSISGWHLRFAFAADHGPADHGLRKMVTTADTRAIPSRAHFPSYVQSAFRVVLRKTDVPVLGPTWIPTPPGWMVRGGAYAAEVHGSSDMYSISWWCERHPLSVNNAAIAQDTTDPNGDPLISVGGVRYPTIQRARKATTLTIPRTAKRVTITSSQTGWIWIARDIKGGQLVPNIAWHERGWLVKTSPMLLSTDRRQWTAEAVATAREVILTVGLQDPSSTGTITVDFSGDGTYVNAKWQRGDVVYSAYSTTGVQRALNTIRSLHTVTKTP